MEPAVAARKLDRFEAYQINDDLAESLRKLGCADLAEEVLNCHRVFKVYLPECTMSMADAIGRTFSCWHRLCPFCNATRSKRVRERLKFLFPLIGSPKLLTLTALNVPEITPEYFKEFRSWFTKLRGLKHWKKNR